MSDLLPNCTLVSTKGLKWYAGQWWEPIFCANCACDGGFVPQSAKTFAFYLCQPCATKNGDLPPTLHVVPDEVFYRRVEEAQLEQAGRAMTEPELLAALDDETNPLAKLAKERYTLPEYRRR